VSQAVRLDAFQRADRAGLDLKRRSLGGACLAHALHDGYTDLLYVLLPVWQAEFGLGYAGLAVLRSLY
jgi:FSR family fosmidomycin resistance protein-like MFS transporter